MQDTFPSPYGVPNSQVPLYFNYAVYLMPPSLSSSTLCNSMVLVKN